MNICFEHPDFIVVEKPQGVPVQSKSGTKESLMSKLDSYFEFTLGIEDPFLGMVHRLDQPTGGLIIVARTPSALKRLNQMIQNHEIHKDYLALVEGIMDLPSQTLTHYLSANQKDNWVTCYDDPQSQKTNRAKKAVLDYQVIKPCAFKDGKVLKNDEALNTELEKATLLSITLQTGRQHQIRTQMAHIGHPLIGDMKYGSHYPTQPLHLWAYRLSFKYKGKDYCIHSKPPFVSGETWQTLL